MLFSLHHQHQSHTHHNEGDTTGRLLTLIYGFVSVRSVLDRFIGSIVTNPTKSADVDLIFDIASLFVRLVYFAIINICV